MGCVTAREVLRTPRQELIDKADLEEDTVDNIIAILKAEFDEDDAPQAADEPADEPADE